MSFAERMESWVFKTVNPFMKSLLRSPLHGWMSGSVTILGFRGRKSGREFATPLSYVREGGTVYLLSARTTSWWKNLREDGTPVTLEIAREKLAGKAKLWEENNDALRARVHRYLCALPRDAVFYSIKLDENRQPVEESLTEVAPQLVFVEITLD